MFSEFRDDGWPLCPNCGEDELYCPYGTDFFMHYKRVIEVQEAIDLGLACYRCHSDFPGLPAAVKTLKKVTGRAIDEKGLEVLVLNFGCSITSPQLDNLGGGVEWEHWTIPKHGRDRLLEAIKRTIADMSDNQGRILQDPEIWKRAVDG